VYPVEGGIIIIYNYILLDNFGLYGISNLVPDVPIPHEFVEYFIFIWVVLIVPLLIFKI
jgi:hypothetical protein